MDIAFVLLFSKKPLIVTSQNREDNNNTLKISNFLFVCRVVIELHETAPVAKKNLEVFHVKWVLQKAKFYLI